MPFIRSENFTSFYQVNPKEVTISERQKRQFLHGISNLYKQATKNSLDKGVNQISASLVDNYVIVSMHGYLTQFERFTMQISADRVELFRKMRIDANQQILNTKKDVLTDFVRDQLGTEIVGYLQDVDILDEYALWVLVLDTTIKVV